MASDESDENGEINHPIIYNYCIQILGSTRFFCFPMQLRYVLPYFKVRSF